MRLDAGARRIPVQPGISEVTRFVNCLLSQSAERSSEGFYQDGPLALDSPVSGF